MWISASPLPKSGSNTVEIKWVIDHCHHHQLRLPLANDDAPLHPRRLDNTVVQITIVVNLEEIMIVNWGGGMVAKTFRRYARRHPKRREWSILCQTVTTKENLQRGVTGNTNVSHDHGFISKFILHYSSENKKILEFKSMFEIFLHQRTMEF